MENYIIIAVILLIVLISINSAVKHFKGQGGCCGGSSFKVKRKKLKNVLYKKTFKVSGIHCEHCKNRIEEVIDDIDGLAAVVNWKKNELLVSYERDFSDEFIKEKLQKFGYEIDKTE